MSSPNSLQYFIGWDVGGWNCDKNAKSRDAIVILDADRKLVGRPWRKNLRTFLENSPTTKDWLLSLFRLCSADIPHSEFQVTMAIDTPLGFSTEFVELIAAGRISVPAHKSLDNKYLFRQTERHLASLGWSPLSAIKDMIGSQATKGIHALAKFAPRIESTGVWTDDKYLTVIETYPTVCRDVPPVRDWVAEHPPQSHEDIQDALVCAVVASLFATAPENLESPSAEVPKSEGWIWFPRNCEN
ncbi:hypothetical protein M4951_07220 [Blastopirellula sp. J2-11]|uniref:hypothetical protein n=1 Tax=Blastopirellula sp. J2-11 TaxID=2943192 RepID=UPI0021C598F8|nr:hypothetical protein [Blastopirellula sp. J2-11]UUO08101.1 hypothetical protein M4951_07220 [Blastopirellula sp. J2-11]